MSNRGIISQALSNRSPESDKFVTKSMDIVNHIHDLLNEYGWSQKKLAGKMEKKESEISNMLTRPHNFTLRTLTKFESVLQEELFSPTKRRGETTILKLSSSNSENNIDYGKFREPSTDSYSDKDSTFNNFPIAS